MRYIILSLLLLLSGCYYYPYYGYPYGAGYAYPRAYAPGYAAAYGPAPVYGAAPAYAGPRQQYYAGPPPSAYAPPTGLDPRNCGTPDEPRACGR